MDDRLQAKPRFSMAGAAGQAEAGRRRNAALAAIGTMCLGIFCLVVNDSIAKWLTDHYSPMQILFMRNLIAAPPVLLAAWAFGGRRALATRHMKLHALRGALLVGGGFSFFLGLSFLPLAEATSLVFAAPIFITALSVPLLGDHVGWRRWCACIVGFVGVLVIIRPGGEAFQTASLLPVTTAVFYSLIMLSARRIDAREGVWTMMVYVTVFPLLYTALLVPFVWRMPDPAHILQLCGIALFGTLGMTLISQSFRMAPAAVVAPFDYTSLLWASILGWLLWGEVPDLATYVGAAIIVGAGIYILYRETRAR